MHEALDRGEDAGTFLFGRSGAVLRKIVDHAAVGMLVAGMDGRVVYRNQAFRREFSLGNGPDAANLNGLLAADDVGGVQALDAMLSGRTTTYEGEHLCRDAAGRDRWAMVALSLLESDATGEPIYLIAQVNSIARRRAAEAALAESESRWHFALEAARQGVWDHDARSGRMFYSPMWRAMRGIPADEPIDDRQEVWLERLHPDDRDRIRGTVGRQNRGEDGFDILEYRERHRDGRYIWILSRGKPVAWDADGKVLRTVGTDADITHLKEIEARLEHAATHDPLTGLANRASFGNAVARAALAGGTSCLLFIDLDRFKPVNDALGHAAGDEVLIAVAREIRKRCRISDMAARIGGDEFVVLLNDCCTTDARRVAEGLVATIAAIPITLKGRPHVLGASIGLVALRHDMGAEAALARADAACYAAKNSGRGRVVVADEA